MGKPATNGMAYGAPQTYEALIAPRYAAIADALVEHARLEAGEHVLELGAGTGLATRRAAAALAPSGALLATDLSGPMLEVARGTVKSDVVTFALVDYAQPLPFLDRSFDVVLSGLTYAQNTAQPLIEVARVLKPGGRLALAMWGTAYGEVQMMSAARRALGLEPYPSAAPGRAVHRLARAGFRHIERRDIELAPRFPNVEHYIEYRRGFGIPLGSTSAQHERYLRALRREALTRTAGDGSLSFTWNVTTLVGSRGSSNSTAARRPARA